MSFFHYFDFEPRVYILLYQYKNMIYTYLDIYKYSYSTQRDHVSVNTVIGVLPAVRIYLCTVYRIHDTCSSGIGSLPTIDRVQKK